MSGLERFDEELLELDTRIERLALACGVDLGQRETIATLITGDYSICRGGGNPRERELRALLMMKYNIEEHCAASLGAAQCRRILEEEEQKLVRRGFKGAAAPR
jgi:hypothetical protein